MKQWPKVGSKVTFKGAKNFWFTSVMNYANGALKVGEQYTISKLELLSSWCKINLEEFPDKIFSLSFFDYEFLIMNTPTLEQKVEQYEKFLHNINMMLIASNSKGVQKLIDHADSWSYSHRVGNGEITEEQQQELINRAFWNLNNIEALPAKARELVQRVDHTEKYEFTSLEELRDRNKERNNL